jgi:hypothetical protein
MFRRSRRARDLPAAFRWFPNLRRCVRGTLFRSPIESQGGCTVRDGGHRPQ